jgi:hypothetical protein
MFYTKISSKIFTADFSVKHLLFLVEISVVAALCQKM